VSEAEDRALARRVAARAQIHDVRLLKSLIELDGVPGDGRRLSFTFDVVESEVDWKPGDSNFVVRCTYELVLTQAAEGDGSEPSGADSSSDEAESDESDEDRIATISFTMAALFQLRMRDSDEAPTPEELTAYASSTGSFALYPFAREYVYDATGRLRLPALTLPVRLISITEDEEIE
jgi:hypothetical protein